MKAIKLGDDEFYPSKIVCVGRNYVDHIAELNNETPGEPIVFIKPNSSIAHEIVFDPMEQLHYEGELTFVVMSGEIAGVGFGLDLTKRGMQSRLKAKGLPWERAKAFDKSAVLSEFVRFSGDVSQLKLELAINGQLVQRGGVDLMLFKPDVILSEVKQFLTLEDGDLIMSGTPSGVGPFAVGDSFVGRVYDGEKLLLQASWVVT